MTLLNMSLSSPISPEDLCLDCAKLQIKTETAARSCWILHIINRKTERHWNLYFVTFDFVTLRGFMRWGNSRSRILLLYIIYILYIIITYNDGIMHLCEGLNVTNSHVTMTQATGVFS